MMTCLRRLRMPIKAALSSPFPLSTYLPTTNGRVQSISRSYCIIQPSFAVVLAIRDGQCVFKPDIRIFGVSEIGDHFLFAFCTVHAIYPVKACSPSALIIILIAVLRARKIETQHINVLSAYQCFWRD
ncbi:hypothetical protein BDW60DRAFT_914 [Aspergillus nidulans var. acristatus]